MCIINVVGDEIQSFSEFDCEFTCGDNVSLDEKSVIKLIKL